MKNDFVQRSDDLVRARENVIESDDVSWFMSGYLLMFSCLHCVLKTLNVNHLPIVVFVMYSNPSWPIFLLWPSFVALLHHVSEFKTDSCL